MDSSYKVGDVLHYYCYVASKDKFHILVCTDPEPLMLLINSEMSAFQRGNPSLIACHANIDCARHAFLSHDSVISCCDVHSEPRDGDHVDHVGQIVSSLWPDIDKAVAASPTMSRRHKNWVLAARS